MKRLEAGDVGIVRRYGRHGTDTPAVVEKVGRRWAYVVTNDERRRDLGRFDADTGSIDGGQYSSNAAFMTPERVERLERMREAWETLKAVGIERRMVGRGPSDDVVLALAEVAARYVEPKK